MDAIGSTVFGIRGVSWIGLVAVLCLGGCGGASQGGGSTGGAPMPPGDRQGRPGPASAAARAASGGPDGLVSGKITAPDDSEFDVVFVELIEAPARVLQRVRARVGQHYRIPYASSALRCRELGVRFISSEMSTPYVRHLGRCGRHVVNFEFPRDE